MAKKKLVPDYKIDLSKDATTNGGTIANIYDSIKDSEKSFYSQLTRLKSKSENNSITLADVARAFIRKDVDDSVAGELSFSKSIKSDNYSQGDLGSGWKMSKDEFGRGTLDIDNINVRNELITKILTYDKIQSAGGTIILSAAWAELTRVEEVDENTINHKVICYYIPEGNFGQMWREGDIIKLQSGTNKYLMSYVESVSNTPDAETGEYSFTIYHGGIENQIGESIPAVGDTLVQFGCLDDGLIERQNIILMSVGDAANTFPYIEQYAQVNSLELSGKLITRISDEVYFGAGDQSKYLWWNQNGGGEFLLKGTLNQSQSGDKSPTLVWRGNYDAATQYYAGDLVMYNGNTYVAKQNSTNKIGDVLYWTLYTSAGTGIESVTQQFHISTSKTVQPVEGSAGWSDSAPAWSVGLYLWSRIKIIYKDPPSTVYTGYSVSTEWEAINSIEFGGRNLMRDTAFTHEGNGAWYLIPQERNYNDTYPYIIYGYGWDFAYKLPLSKGAYTLSMKCKSHVTDSHGYLRVYLPEIDDFFISETTNEWRTYKITFTILEDIPLVQICFLSNLTEEIRFAHIKLEHGNVATDWTQAPEDIQAEIDEANNYIDAVNTYLQKQIDGVVDSWFYDYVPTTGNYPANEWDTLDKKERHIGDTFTNTQKYVDEDTTPHAGESWRWLEVSVGSNTYHWSSIADSDAVRALLEASKAQDTADSKRRVFTITPFTPYSVGDLWAQGAVGDLMKCKTERLTGSYSFYDWEKASKYTDDTAANAAQQAAEAAAIAAGIANDKLNQWASDGYIDPSEKQSVKAVWNEIQAEEPKIVAQAVIYSADSTAYVQAYSDLYYYLSSEEIIINITVASTIDREDFKDAFSLYYSERQLLLNDIAQKAKDFVGESIDAIEVGGRNYVKKSDTFIKIQTAGALDRVSDYEWRFTGDENTSEVLFRMPNVINSNGFWTLSFDLASSQSVAYSLLVDMCDMVAIEAVMTTDNKYRRIKLTGNITNYSAELYNFIDFRCAGWSYYHIKNIKLEKGTLATDWTPAHEDVVAVATNTKTVRYSKWKAGNYYFAGNVDDGGVGNNPLRYLDYVTNNRTDSAIGAYECKSYHLANIYNEPKTGTPPVEWANTTYYPTIAGDIALFNEAVLGGFAFSPSYDDNGNLIPASSQELRTTDSPTTPAIRLAGDGSGHLAGGKIKWGSATEDGEVKIEFTKPIETYTSTGSPVTGIQTTKISNKDDEISLITNIIAGLYEYQEVIIKSQGIMASYAGMMNDNLVTAAISVDAFGNQNASAEMPILCGVYGNITNNNSNPSGSFGGYFERLRADGFYANITSLNDSNNNITLNQRDYYVPCYNNSTLNVYLPSSPQLGHQLIFKLMKSAKVVIRSSSSNIFRQSASNSLTIDDGSAGRGVTLIWDGTYWGVLFNQL